MPGTSTCNPATASSVAVAVGMIAVAGLSVELGLLMVLHLDLSWRRRIAEATMSDLRMKRIAAPMLGGVGSGLLLVLFVFPAMFSFWRGRDLSVSRPPNLR